jgi:hypothetical protein
VHTQALVEALEITSAIARDTMTQREVLGTRGGADGIGLHEAECIECALQRRRRKQASRHGEAS